MSHRRVEDWPNRSYVRIHTCVTRNFVREQRIHGDGDDDEGGDGTLVTYVRTYIRTNVRATIGLSSVGNSRQRGLRYVTVYDSELRR